jgi:D-alanyl-D-alanine carboxypeptidase (penicillin-binding protein 5/6)
MTLWPNTLDTSTIKEDIDTAEFIPADGIIDAPVKKGQIMGSLSLSHSGNVLVTVPLAAKNNVELDNIAFMTDKAKRFPDSVWFKTAIAVTIFLSLLYTGIFIAVLVHTSRKKTGLSFGKK